jgi:rubrerythrin
MKCRVCNKEFSEIKALSVHLIKDHKYKAEELYKYFNYSFEEAKGTCPICGKEFQISKDQLRKHKKGISKGIGCCGRCSITLYMLLEGSPLSKKEVQEKIRKTNIEKYGVENPSSASEVKEKRKQTFLERYGVDSVCRIEEFKEKNHEKMKQTNLKKYGSKNIKIYKCKI